MVIGNGKAYSIINPKSASLRSHHDGWWLPRVVLRELELAHIVAVFVWVVGQAEDNEMPDKYIILLRCSYEIILNQPVILVYLLLELFS